ncbi:hypothetical protein N7509_004896 [Penicillium cosmopolitanum]|uniref:NADP-dependent oxidoreductase domain-containing protein n=1 Tax=Penicillium cosmopolitanum TaxID=1131564 RepID=A0A9X0B9J2_9EURO|nr:uncharacterized protein N7509_004896 [Penicillium cosmopolitanum]KAJ5396783.1 hypothetical protein N7509_004896 [Penicillium cosmopolitanum]
MDPQLCFVYGTAWKKVATADLVHQAIRAGFRIIDMAAQPRHYREDLVGEGMRAAIIAGDVQRSDLLIQTKFTWTSGQDHKTIPFNPDASIPLQVRQSVASSLYNLRSRDNPESVNEAYIDCLLLHFPLPTLNQTLQVWTALQKFVPSKIRTLGICNTSLPVLQALFRAKSVTLKPSVVQNRFHAETSYDWDIREFCAKENVIYQGFGVLKSNKWLLSTQPVIKLAEEINTTLEIALFLLISEYPNFQILNGTGDENRMETDLKLLQQFKEWKVISHNSDMTSLLHHQFSAVLMAGH